MTRLNLVPARRARRLRARAGHLAAPGAQALRRARARAGPREAASRSSTASCSSSRAPGRCTPASSSSRRERLRMRPPGRSGCRCWRRRRRRRSRRDEVRRLAGARADLPAVALALRRSALLAVGLRVLVGRALYLQGWNNDFLQAKGESRYSRTLEIPANRGRILDRNGEALAVSTPVKSIWAIPEDVDALGAASSSALAQAARAAARRAAASGSPTPRATSSTSSARCRRRSPTGSPRCGIPGSTRAGSTAATTRRARRRRTCVGFTDVDERRPGGHRARVRGDARRPGRAAGA